MEDLVAETTSMPDFEDDIDQLEFDNTDQEIDLENLEKMAEDAPVVKLVNVVLVDALRRGASDIHIEPYEKEFRVRFRMDGVLYHIMSPPDEDARCAYIAIEDHGQARHRREETASRRPNQDSSAARESIPRA